MSTNQTTDMLQSPLTTNRVMSSHVLLFVIYVATNARDFPAVAVFSTRIETNYPYQHFAFSLHWQCLILSHLDSTCFASSVHRFPANLPACGSLARFPVNENGARSRPVSHFRLLFAGDHCFILV